MSSRQLRKLQKQKELQGTQAQNADNPDNPDNDESSSEDDRPIQKPRASLFSGFAALGDEGKDEQGSEDGQDEKETEPENVAVKPIAESDIADTPKTSPKKNKKKKKKAKKQQATTPQVITKSGPDEIEQVLRELEVSKKSKEKVDTESRSTRPYDRICELLSINNYHLRVLNEMRNLFGRDAIAAAQQEEEQEQPRPRRPQQFLQQEMDLETFLKGHPGKSLPEGTRRRNPFLAGKDTWPLASTEGLTMNQLKEEEGSDGKSGIQEFRFAHDAVYNKLEVKFFELVQMYDPMLLVHFLQKHPYHISSLIQVSRIAKQDQNSALSADLCERALFTFGRVSLSAFRQKIEQGKARLSFNRPENRQFFLAGYHYLKNLVMKGTYRTALEWAKLLLSLDQADPYGIVNFIHPLAIRAYESDWFVDFCDSAILDKSPSQGGPEYIKQTLVLARLQLKDKDGAKALLIKGMRSLPWLYGHLFMSLNLDVPRSIWGMQPRTEGEELHTKVYVHQTRGLWDNAQAISILKKAAVETKRADVDATFLAPPLATVNLARFVYLLEIPSLIGAVPRELLNTSVNWEFDPLPPARDDNVFSYDSQQLPWGPPHSPEPSVGGRFQGDRRELRRILDHARLAGAPIQVQEDLEQVLQEALDEQERRETVEEAFAHQYEEDAFGFADGVDHELAEPHGLNGVAGAFQAFMELFDPRHMARDASALDAPMAGMPGAWRDEDEASGTGDELPPSMPEGGTADDDESNDDIHS